MTAIVELDIAGRKIGPNYPPYIVCELSANHNGSLERALQLVEAAAATGADAIKIQTYTPDTMTIDCDDAQFLIKGGLWNGYKLYSLYGEAFTPYDWHPALFAKAREVGVTLFSTPFDETAVDLLVTLGAPAYKIASFEAADLTLVARVAATGTPVIISTGTSRPEDVAETVATARLAGGSEIVLLHCVSAYPAHPRDSNVRTIPHLAQRHGTLVGLSDHTLGTAVAVSAVALGACVIEKHFTLRRSDGGPDAAFSLEPPEFSALVRDCKTAWEALGEVREGYQRAAEQNLVFRRSIYAVRDIARGVELTKEDIRSIRPGYGLMPKYLPELIGRRARVAIRRGTPMSWDLLED
jgi:N-acetylneuraminate synthase